MTQEREGVERREQEEGRREEGWDVMKYAKRKWRRNLYILGRDFHLR